MIRNANIRVAGLVLLAILLTGYAVLQIRGASSNASATLKSTSPADPRIRA